MRWGKRFLTRKVLAAVLSVAALAAAGGVYLGAHGGGTKAVSAAQRQSQTADTSAVDLQTRSGAYVGIRVAEQNNQLTIVAVLPNSPAAQANLQRGDVITSVNGAAVHTTQDLQNALSGKNAGDTLTLTIQRNGATQQVQVTLQARPAAPGQNASRGLLGVSVQNATSADQQQYHLSTTSGALVVGVQSNGPAANAGIQKGDLITGVNGSAVNNVADLTNALLNAKPGDTVSVRFERSGNLQTVNVTLATGPAGRGGGLPGALPALGGPLGGNFDNFISTVTTTKDANGQVHTDTTIGGIVKSASSSQLVVTPNGGGADQTFTIDTNTRILGGRGRSAAGSGNPTPAQGDHVLVTTRDGSTTATVVVIVPNPPAGNGAQSGGASGGNRGGPGGRFFLPAGGGRTY